MTGRTFSRNGWSPSRRSGYDLTDRDVIDDEWGEVRWTDGAEVWSEMFESRLSLFDFYARRYTEYDYHPD